MVLKAYGCSIAWCRHELSATHFIKNLVSTSENRRANNLVTRCSDSFALPCLVMVFMHLVVVWIGQFCRDVIGRQNVKVAVIGRLLFCFYFRSVYCLLRYVGFVWGHAWVFCKVQVIVGFGSEVLVLSLCTSFLMSVFVGRLCFKWRIQTSPSRFCV